MSPERRSEAGQGEGRQDRRPAVHRHARSLAALLDPGGRADARTCSRRASASTARRSAASRRSTSRTCCCSPTPRRRQMDPFTGVPTLVLICDVKDPITGAELRARSALRREEGRGLRQEHGHRRHDLHRARARVLHPRQRALRPGLQLRLLPPRLRGGHLEQRPRGHAGEPEPGLPAALQAGLLPGLPRRPPPGPALRDGAEPRERAA